MGTTSNRFPYLTATVLDQSFLDECQDNLTCQLEMVVDIERPDSGFIRASDRNKYVGGTFYEALLKFPVISRTAGDWLANTVEFSDLVLELSNVDQRFNDILPGGANFDGWIGKTISVTLGLRDEISTYTTIFEGQVSEIGGFGRSIVSIKFTARDKFDQVNQSLPSLVFSNSTYPNIDDSLIGVGVPYIWGDFTSLLASPADVPAYPVNSLDPDVNGDNDPTRNNIQLVISDNDNTSLDTNNIYLLRNDTYDVFHSADIVSVSAGKNYFEISQNTGNTKVTPADKDDPVKINYVYESGDEIFTRVVGKNLSPYTSNGVWIAKDILKTFGGLVDADFDSNWDTFRDKNSPSQSAIANIPMREWRQESITAIELALSFLEQIRLEAFVDRSLKFKINSLHFEDWISFPSFKLDNFDVIEKSMKPRIDVRNNFNRAKASFSRNPSTGETAFETLFRRNQASIDQVNKTISKIIVYPNMPDRDDVELQMDEVLRISSGYLEQIDLSATWRAMLLDVGDFVRLNVQIQSVVYENVPCMIRSIGYDPDGLKIVLKLWSMQMLPFPSYEPGYAGTVGGYNATITQE